MENLPDNRDNPVDDKGNWTIKGFPAEVANRRPKRQPSAVRAWAFGRPAP